MRLLYYCMPHGCDQQEIVRREEYMSIINIKIEGIPYQVEDGLTILEAAKACGYEIPSLCAFNHGECNSGSCRVCLVEATGAR